MTVFRGNVILLKRNLGLSLLYLGIFLFIALLVQGVGSKQEDIQTFEVVNSKVGVVDNDQSTFSKGLISYLEQNNLVYIYEDDKEFLTEMLYYDNVYSIVVIPEGFFEDCLEGEGVVDITNAPNIMSGMYVDMDISKYIFQVQTLIAAEFSDEEIVSMAIENSNIESHIEMIKTGSERKDVAPYNFYFQYLPYVYLSTLILMLGNIFIPRNQKDMSQRLKCSSVSETKQSMETFLAFGMAGVAVFVVTLLFATGFYAKELYADQLVGYYIFNSFIFMIVSLCISFMIASVAKGQEALSGLANVVSLGLCFIGGVFVPLQFLGAGIIKVAKFLPTYWFETNNNLLGNYMFLKSDQIATYRNGIFVQLAIAAVCITIAFMINSKKDSHVN